MQREGEFQIKNGDLTIDIILCDNFRYTVTMIPGDGVGPELMDSVQAVVKSAGAPVDFETFHLSEVQVWSTFLSIFLI